MSDLSKSEMAVLGFVRGYFSGTGEFPHTSDVSVGLGINMPSVRNYKAHLTQKGRLEFGVHDKLVIPNHNLPHRTHEGLPAFMHERGIIAIKFPE